jgi:ribosomal protein L39E
MAIEDGNPQGGIGLHEATLAISNLLGPEQDNQEEAEALDQEEAEEQELDQESETEEVEEYEEETEYDEADDVEDSESDDEEVEEEATQELSEDLTLKVKVDGEEMEVTLAELRNGYSRTADYTRKATALADQRKSLEAEVEAIRAERTQYAQLLPILQQQIQQQNAAEPDWDTLYDEDPIEAARLERHWRRTKDEQTQRLAAIQAEQQRLTEEETKQRTQQMQAVVEAERARLPEVIPEWKDQETMMREAQELREWATSNGLTEQDVNSLTQAAHIALIRKAMLYDKGVKNVEKAKQPAKKKARVVRPGSSNSSAKPGSVDIKRASKRLAQTGRVDDAAKLLDKLI